jgi:protein SMG6
MEEGDGRSQVVSPLNFCLACIGSRCSPSLSELMLNLLEISLAPGVPDSLRRIPEKYNIIIRLWTNCFYRLLENLRRSSLTSKIALEYLQEFIYYAYTFYTALLERNTFSDYRSNRLESLGDVASSLPL